MPSSAHQHATKPESTSANKPKAATTPASLQSNLSIDQQTIMRIQRMAGNQAALRFVQRQVVQRDGQDDVPQKLSMKANVSTQMATYNPPVMIGELLTPLLVQNGGATPPGVVNPGQRLSLQAIQTVPGAFKTVIPADIEQTQG